MSTTHTRTALIPYVVVLFFSLVFFISTDVRSIWIAIDGIPFGKTLLIFSQFFFGIHLAIFIWRIVLFLNYRTTPPCKNEELPTCTVIVPAYNEGGQVYETIRSIIQSDYPPEKMSIFGIDDGSVDDTWQWLKKAKLISPTGSTFSDSRSISVSGMPSTEGSDTARGTSLLPSTAILLSAPGPFVIW